MSGLPPVLKAIPLRLETEYPIKIFLYISFILALSASAAKVYRPS